MKIFSQKIRKITISIFIILFVFILSLVLFFIKSKGIQRTFIFPSIETGKLVVEKRNLPKNPVQGDINLFIDELLLGSGVERTKLLFTLGTKVESCFLRGDILYLNLSDDLIQMGNEVLDIQDGVLLLKKNIEKNFPKVKTIQIFIDGKFAFE